MRLRSSSLLVGLGLSLALMQPVRAEDGCDLAAKEIPSADAERVGDALWAPECREHERALVDRLDALLQAGELGEEFPPAQIAWMSGWIAWARVRFALTDRDPALARARLAAVEATAKGSATQALDDDLEEDVEVRAELLARVDGILAVLDGQQAFVAPVKLDSPRADWTLSFGTCGTPAAMFHQAAVMLPSAADAWSAVGHADIGLQQVLVEQWIDAISLGMAPPRLREFAELAFGARAYEREVERGLAAIRIVQAPDGLRAYLPLFGLELPVPLGTQRWKDEAVIVFDTEQKIAEFMRSVLLRGDEA